MTGSATSERTTSAFSIAIRASGVICVPSWIPVPTTVSEPEATT